MLRKRKKVRLNSDNVFHAPGTGSNVLCCNGSAHARSTSHLKTVNCPACRAMLDKGHTVTEAIEAWDKHRSMEGVNIVYETGFKHSFTGMSS